MTNTLLFNIFENFKILHLRILSAQQLPRPRGSTAKGNSTDPYVVVEIFGCPTDRTVEKTRTVRNDGKSD